MSPVVSAITAAAAVAYLGVVMAALVALALRRYSVSLRLWRVAVVLTGALCLVYAAAGMWVGAGFELLACLAAGWCHVLVARSAQIRERAR